MEYLFFCLRFTLVHVISYMFLPAQNDLLLMFLPVRELLDIMSIRFFRKERRPCFIDCSRQQSQGRPTQLMIIVSDYELVWKPCYRYFLLGVWSHFSALVGQFSEKLSVFLSYNKQVLPLKSSSDRSAYRSIPSKKITPTTDIPLFPNTCRKNTWLWWITLQSIISNGQTISVPTQSAISKRFWHKKISPKKPTRLAGPF